MGKITRIPKIPLQASSVPSPVCLPLCAVQRPCHPRALRGARSGETAGGGTWSCAPATMPICRHLGPESSTCQVCGSRADPGHSVVSHGRASAAHLAAAHDPGAARAPACWMIVRGHRRRSCCAAAWERAPTPVEMSADVAISTALLVTERGSRTPSSPCCARVILAFSTVCLLSMR